MSQDEACSVLAGEQLVWMQRNNQEWRVLYLLQRGRETLLGKLLSDR